MRLSEDTAKRLIGDSGVAVPRGIAAGDTDEASAAFTRLEAGTAMVKALVPAGRRGKAGGVVPVRSAVEAGDAARRLLGSELGGHVVARVYVEEAVEIRSEVYLGMTFSGTEHLVVASARGGVDIEDHLGSDDTVRLAMDPRTELGADDAVALWERAGVPAPDAAGLAAITTRAHGAFIALDALILELNPIALGSGPPMAVGALVEVDDAALFRHPDLAGDAGDAGLTAGERLVAAADRTHPGGAVRYRELDGTVGLLVGGGGAGLLQHDLLLHHGLRPANHSDYSPTPTPDKAEALLEAVFTNPRVELVLVSFNHLQMASCAIIAEAVRRALQRTGFDPERHPIVVRLTGPGEDEARRLLEPIAGVHYLPPGTGLGDAVRLVAELAAER